MALNLIHRIRNLKSKHVKYCFNCNKLITATLKTYFISDKKLFIKNCDSKILSLKFKKENKITENCINTVI